MAGKAVVDTIVGNIKITWVVVVTEVVAVRVVEVVVNVVVEVGGWHRRLALSMQSVYAWSSLNGWKETRSGSSQSVQ